jgi:membrane-bound lytic murein transglycosylase D
MRVNRVNLMNRVICGVVTSGLALVTGSAELFAQSTAQTLPIPARAQVDAWTVRFSSTHRSAFERSLANAAPWAEMIAAKLHAAQLPAALIYVPLVESSFDVRAINASSGAAGLWQLMPKTARDYGLEVSAELDERHDPWKSTDAAVRLLADLWRSQRGNWYLALASYNAGGPRITARTRGVADASDPTAYWQAQGNYPRETQAYVPQLLAAYQIGADPARYGVRLPATSVWPALLRVVVPARTALVDIAAVWNLSIAQVRALNPALRGDVTPSRAYAIVLPADDAAARRDYLVASRSIAR